MEKTKPHYRVECDCGRVHILSKGAKPGEIEIEVDESEFERQEDERKKRTPKRIINKEEKNDSASEAPEDRDENGDGDGDEKTGANTIFDFD